MSFINNYIEDLKKNDTLLAFFVSSILYYCDTQNLEKSFIFAIKFVLIFLLFLNLIN